MRFKWLALAGVAFGPLAAADEPAASVEALYEQHCLACHGAALQGSAHGPPLKGEPFLDRWGGSRQALLAYNLATMPPGGSSLSASEQAALVDFLLADSETGRSELEAGDAGAAVDSWYGVAGIDEIARSRSAFRNRTIEAFEPVSDARLRDPPPGDWLHWRRTQDGQAHSPLTQIGRANVDRLQLAWAVTMREGSNQVTPLAHDGILYLTHPDNVVQALDGATGELIWEYAYDYPPAAKTLGGPLRNIAIRGDKLFLATYDAALVAVDARTGELAWRTVKADYRKGYTHSSGPIVGGGVLLSGINGCERFQPDGCFITGHDPATGRELWRTSTIALPGHPGDETWGGLAAEFRAGGDVWIAGSYDPKLGLYYVGTSQAKPWIAASRGMTVADAALYTNSTLALDAQTGEIAWHFQHAPGETIDMETGFERLLIDRHGEQRLYTVGKDGILWLLDRRTGRYLR
ncbi:MAG: PQQ-binding-like beta-propeller repeat protein, partial [Gammaproteobacteria bacterium]|nr:PQQ-binding-like beta-propeller repeat protein [Gammaproteobacteria bacterium]